MTEIEFYRTASGRCPVEDFLDDLTGKQAKKVTWVLQLISELEQIPVQYWKKLSHTDEIWEARVNFGRDTFRLLGFFAAADCIVLTNGFQKKSQKTPRTEIEVAEQRKKEFEQRSNK